jgi:uncharacterized delta-60 repeat protein
VQPDGKFITAGHIFNGGFSDNFLINRFNSDGSYDKSFGVNGSVSTIFSGGNSLPYAIKILPDGKFFVAGVFISTAVGLHSNMVIAKYNTDGSLDKTFGAEGSSMIDFNKRSSEARNLLLQKDGKIILTGYTEDCYGCGNTDFAIGRLNIDGSIDSSFASAGKQISDFGTPTISKTSQLQDDKKIVLIGEEANTASIVLARYNNDERSKKQILIAKIRRWLQHHNGIVWDNISGIKNYAVQRSGDGGKWSTVYRSPITVNNQATIVNSQLSTVKYYNDASPLPGTNYYRLQVTSVDGAVAYSNVITINNEPSTISISPNPAKNVLRIEGLSSSQNLPTGRQAKITVVDLNGNVACSVQLKANSSYYNLNIAALKPGNYWLKVEVNGEVVTKQFVKE